MAQRIPGTAHTPGTGLSIPGRVVVFDYGEVISLSPSERAKADLLAVAGVVYLVVLILCSIFYKAVYWSANRPAPTFEGHA